MDWSTIIQELGGGPAAVGMAGLAFAWWKSTQRNDQLVDKIIELSRDQTAAINELSRSIERGVGQ